MTCWWPVTYRDGSSGGSRNSQPVDHKCDALGVGLVINLWLICYKIYCRNLKKNFTWNWAICITLVWHIRIFDQSVTGCRYKSKHRLLWDSIAWPIRSTMCISVSPLPCGLPIMITLAIRPTYFSWTQFCVKYRIIYLFRQSHSVDT